MIGDRMKRYEQVSNHVLLPRSPVIIRVDGKAFHTFTAKMERPFDTKLIESMVRAGEQCAKEMMNFKLGYHQSDEFTFFLLDTDEFETQAWFNNELQKLSSITASMFTAYFNKEMGGTSAVFDARGFNVPTEEIANVFIWRQRDWERNSVQMLSRFHFSHKELLNKKQSDMHEMLHDIGINWNDLAPILKNGTFVTKDGARVHEKLSYDQINMLF